MGASTAGPAGSSTQNGAAGEDRGSPLERLAGRAPAGIREPLRSTLRRAASIDAGGPVTGLLALVAVGLAVAWKMDRVSLPVAASMLAEALVAALFVIAVWDLLVRWDELEALPILTSPPSPRWARRLLRYVRPPFVLLLGVVAGHFIWR